MPPVVGWVTPEMCLPGRAGVAALIEAAPRVARYQANGRLDPVSLAGMLAEAYERRVNRHAFGDLLAKSWMAAGTHLEMAAGGREPVVRWFRYADFGNVSLPWARAAYGLHLLPDRPLILWRGGRGTPAQVANSGMSWTLSKPVAAFYTQWARAPIGGPDDDQPPPVLLRRTAVRGQALVYFATAEKEVVMPTPESWTAETPGTAVLERLRRAAWPPGGAPYGHFGPRAPLTSEEAWQGWTG